MKEFRTASASSNSPGFSVLGEKLAGSSSIGELMTDLGQAMTLEPDMRMLGGGNPAPVPALQALIRQRMEELLGSSTAFDNVVGNYDPPQGNPRFRHALAEMLQQHFGWDIGPQNIAVTCGAQSAYFFLFNLLAGTTRNGKRKKILLPLAPEYTGYADQGIEPDLFVSCRPTIDWPQGPEARIFKYRIDFSAVRDALQRENIGAIAVSRPTNPSGNVVSNAELERLSDLGQEHGIPLIIDNAYGTPFPGILFVPADPHWRPGVILTLSLSKLGLPGTRTGIVIAPEPIVKAVSSMTAVIGLANNNLGQELVLPWIKTGEILNLGSRILRPFYEEKSRVAQAWARESFTAAGLDWALHACEGAFFHWVWLRGLGLTSRELYQKLKARKVLTVPGEYFFFGLNEDWGHRRECLRLNFSQDAAVVQEGLAIIAEEAASARK
jgi:valine--pyruvate aminotransferase